MVLELAASRMLSPFFGAQYTVWTAIIGIILLANGIGNYAGGRLADKYDNDRIVFYCIVSAASFSAVIPLIYTIVAQLIASNIQSVRLGALLTTLILFFLPSQAIGILTPVITKKCMEFDANKGKHAGTVATVNTLGGLIGTFLAGFYLVPKYGSTVIVMISALLLLLLALLTPSFFQIVKKNLSAVIWILITAPLIIGQMQMKATELLHPDNIKIVYEGDSELTHIVIFDNLDTQIRHMVLGSIHSYSSEMYLDQNKENETPSAYVKTYTNALENDRELNTLLIGGGGYSLPRFAINNYPNLSMDVVEIDQMVTDLAKQYFRLNELEQKANAEKQRLNLINADGRVYLNQTDKKYDIIFNDAFSGGVPVGVLATKECAENVKNALTNDGAYEVNIISALEGENSKFLQSELKTLQSVFQYTYVKPVRQSTSRTEVQNVIVFASDRELSIDDAVNVSIEDGILLTDEYVPVDSLIPKRNNE